MTTAFLVKSLTQIVASSFDLRTESLGKESLVDQIIAGQRQYRLPLIGSG